MAQSPDYEGYTRRIQGDVRANVARDLATTEKNLREGQSHYRDPFEERLHRHALRTAHNERQFLRSANRDRGRR